MSRRNGFHFSFDDPRLDPRRLLSRAGLAPAPALVRAESTPQGHVPTNLFHHDGINGKVLHQSFVNQLNDRLTTSGNQTQRVIQAFQAFATAYAQLPVSPAPGSSGPTAASLLSSLQTEVDYALGHREVLTSRPGPSQANGLRVSPLAPEALIPYADAQIQQLGATLAATPPTTGSDGSPRTADPTPAINTAVNAILNALAEASIHPNLFQGPSDFYISPDVKFTLNSTGVPAESSPGFFLRGPHGVILPGAPPHPQLSS